MLAIRYHLLPALILVAVSMGEAQAQVVSAGYAGGGTAPATIQIGHSVPVTRGVRCNCPECRDDSFIDRFCAKLEVRGRNLRRGHYYWTFDHYRHELHPECPPYCTPGWGYYQTCWRRFPEETLWCPTCPPPAGSFVPPPAAIAPPAPLPAGPTVAPPAEPPAPEPEPDPAPMPEDPAYEEAAPEAPAEDVSLFRLAPPPSEPFADDFSPAPSEAPDVVIEPIGAVSDDSTMEPAPPIHPRNRWRMPQ